MIVGNLVQDALGSDDNQVVIYDAAGRHPVPRGAKDALALRIVEHLGRLLVAA